MSFFDFLTMVGGLALFLYGMNLMGDGLSQASGGRLERILEKLTSNPLKAVLLGAGVTAVIQSSSATTVMVVGFVNSGIMKLQQAVGIIMGANIGTTITSWILGLSGIDSSSFFVKLLKPTSFSPILAILGVVFLLFTKKDKLKNASAILIGFAILMFGMDTMSEAVKPLRDVPEFTSILTRFSNPILGMLAGLVLTAVIQSSSASVGILQALCATGAVGYGAAIPIIMGQNIGTCVTAMMSSIGAKRAAKTAARMHLLFNIIGSVIFSIVAILLLTFVFPTYGEGIITQTEISIIHTVFNIGTTVLLFPFSDYIIKLAKKLDKEEEGDVYEGKVLVDERMLQTPGIAMERCSSEILRMGQIVERSMDKVKEVMFTRDVQTIIDIKEEETIVDNLSSGLSNYIVKLSSLSLNEKEHQKVASMLQVLSDIERISDHCENISEYAETLTERNTEFTEYGAEHLKEMISVCIESYKYALEALAENSKEKAMKVIEKESAADDLEIKLRNKHMKRLASGQCSTDAGLVFLDALVSMERISDHARNIAEEVLTA